MTKTTKTSLRPLAWAVACDFCNAVPGSPCTDNGHSVGRRLIYRGYNRKTGMLTRPCFHGARWKRAHELPAPDQLAAIELWTRVDEKWSAIEPTAEYADFVKFMKSVSESRRG